MTFVVRTTGDPARLGPAAVRVIRQIDPLLPVSAVRPLDEVFAESIARPRLTAVAMSVFAARRAAARRARRLRHRRVFGLATVA